MLSVLTPDESSPTRIAAQVVSGIGFLGGGVILKEGASVRGLNTAATIWCAAAVGAFAGSGYIPQATIGAGAVLISNILLQPLKGTELELVYLQKPCGSPPARPAAAGHSAHPSQIASPLQLEDKPDLVKVEAELVTRTRDDQALEQVVRRLSLEPGVMTARWGIIEQEFG